MDDANSVLTIIIIIIIIINPILGLGFRVEGFKFPGFMVQDFGGSLPLFCLCLSLSLSLFFH
jgi:hypothetical protein